MTSGTILKRGKIPARLLESLLPDAVTDFPEVLVGPRIGEDACAIRIGGDVLVAATDPITMTGTGVGAHAVAINANDVAVMGVKPRWFLANVLLPTGSTVDDLHGLFKGMRDALDELQVALVGGHTEVSDAVNQVVVVGQMLGLAGPAGIVKTGGLRPGDKVVQVGVAPVEGAAVMAELFSCRLSDVAPGQLAAARFAIESPGISVVGSALLAAELGACALHDPTEGGLSAGLHEMAQTSGLGLVVDEPSVLWFPPGIEICKALGADPWSTLASGALLAGFAASRVQHALNALAKAGFQAAVIAEARVGSGVLLSSGNALLYSERDELSRLAETDISHPENTVDSEPK